MVDLSNHGQKVGTLNNVHPADFAQEATAAKNARNPAGSGGSGSFSWDDALNPLGGWHLPGISGYGVYPSPTNGLPPPPGQ